MEEKLKIGLFCDTYFPMMDGVVSVVDNYARRLTKYADVTVFTIKGRTDYDDSQLPYKVVRCKALRFPKMDYDLGLPKMDGKFKKALKESDLDFIHIHSPFSLGKIGVKYAKKHNIPVIATNHSQYKKDFYKSTKSKLLTNILLKSVMKVFNNCDENWSVNSEVANVFYSYGAKVKPRVENNATDMMFIENSTIKEEFVEKYGIKEDEKILLFLGRIILLKNVFFLLDSLKVLKEKGFKFKMFYVGSGPDLNKLNEKIKEYGLENQVFTLGKIMDRAYLAEIYKISDLFVFPSKYDCSSIVQIEAASQKTPTLFLEGSVTACDITDNVNGYLASEDVNNYSDKIIEIFSDIDKYNEVCDNAYRDIYIHWDTKIDQIYKKYIEIINRKKEENK